MEFQAIFLLLGILILVVYFITLPFTRSSRQTHVDDKNQSVLLSEQDHLLTALSELDFDHSLGKIPEEDYPTQRRELVRRGGEVMERLDALSILAPRNETPQIENPKKPLSDDEIEKLITKRRSNRIEKTGSYCPKCGKDVLITDHFCNSCGHPVK
jgi:hypothetical protein